MRSLPNDLNPGIRKSVALLRAWGFDTVDSGDGETHTHECDREEPYIVVRVAPRALITESNRLARLLAQRGVTVVPLGSPDAGGVAIQASYEPANQIAVIDVMGIHDRLIWRGGRRE